MTSSDVSAVVVSEEATCFVARTSEGTEVRLQPIYGRERLVVGAHVLLRRVRPGLRALESFRFEIDDAHRDAYEVLLLAAFEKEGIDPVRARERIEHMRARASEQRRARGEPSRDRPSEMHGRVVRVTNDGVLVELEDGESIEVARLDCDGFVPAAGLRVIASHFYRRASGALVAEDLAIDEATRAALRDVAKRGLGASAEEAVIEARLLEDPSDEVAWNALQTIVAPHVEEALDDVDLTFVHGYVSSARVRPGTVPVRERLEALLARPSTRFLFSLAVEANDLESLSALPRGRKPSIRRLEIGHDPRIPLEIDPGRLVSSMPRLRELVLVGTPRRFDPKKLLHLSRLEIRTTALPREMLAKIVSIEWPALEALVLWLGKESSIRDLAPVFGDTFAPKLVELGLCQTTITNHLARALAKSTLLARLRRIDLSGGTMTDGGAAAIGAAASAFAKVEALDARSNLLTPLGEEYLRIAVPSARTEGQRVGYGEGKREIALETTP